MRRIVFVLLPFFLCHPLSAQTVSLDTVEAGRFDNGKMWLFERPPVDYLTDQYDFTPDQAWFERARLSVLRLPGCSASFVSPNGLVVTNHHCVRGRLSSVERRGEELLDNGFYAASVGEERKIPNYYADQLIAIEDVTDQVRSALKDVPTGRRQEVLEEVRAEVSARIGSRYDESESIQVQVISLYSGGLYSAYVFRRYTDIRFVMAVELQLGFFGGEADNFTYPRYALDYAFLRIYEDGEPMDTPNHFTYSDEGVSEGDLVFVIGNPGSTSRQLTVAQLLYLRDVQVASTLRFLNDRLASFEWFHETYPAQSKEIGIRNRIFGISNSQKAYAGRSEALNDPYIIARRADAEADFKKELGEQPEVAAQFAGLFAEMASIQEQMRDWAAQYGAFRLIDAPWASSALVRRAMFAHRLVHAADTAQARAAREALLSVNDWPPALEQRLLTNRLDDFLFYLGVDHPAVASSLNGPTPQSLAEKLAAESVLATRESTENALDGTDELGADPLVQLADRFMDDYDEFVVAMQPLLARENELESVIGRARWEVYGTDVPPDATFSPRFTDGVVSSYEYNGTIAPVHTTLFGMLDRYYSHRDDPDWFLPPRWQNPPAFLDLSTPLNFISTSDTIGGNSGSPAVTRDLRLVGLNFDRNIQGLSRDYIYLPERGRNIMVDMRAVSETLDVMYDADRLVAELKTGTLFENEAEVDERP